MDFSFTAEQCELRDAVRGFLGKGSAARATRRAVGSPGSARTWDQLVHQLGLTGLAVPERYGGTGASFTEVAIVLEQMGRQLYAGPYLSTVTAAAAIEAALAAEPARQAGRKALVAVAADGAVATLAVAEEASGWGLTGLRTTAREIDGGVVVDGVKEFVLDGASADLILVAASYRGAPCLFSVAGNAPGLARHRHPTLDQTREQARLTFSGVAAQPVAGTGTGPGVCAHAVRLAQVGLAAESVGGAARCLEMTVDYLKTRVQFGRVLGTFQALRHRCADLAVAVTAATSTAYYAAWAAASAPGELPVVAPLAKAYCSEVFARVAAETIQLHGGIGFTWEHDAHLYFKRAASTRLLFGSARELRREAAARAGI